MFKKVLISIMAVLTLGSTCAFSTATVSASRKTTQAQLEKNGVHRKSQNYKKNYSS